jgi:membrane protease YdiL (CAAX protease family)
VTFLSSHSLYLRSAAASGIDCALLLGPLLIYGVVRRSRGAYLACLALLGMSQLEQLMIFLPSSWGAAGPGRVWQGKTLELVAFLALSRLMRLSAAESGIRWPARARSFAFAIMVGLLLSASDILRFAHGHWLPPWRTGPDVLLFELTLPGLAEEVSYRAVMLGAADRYLGRPWRAFGVEFGMGAVLTSLMFSLAHNVMFDRSWRLAIDLGPMLEFFVFALTMCWMRYRWSSIWPGALAHNVNNSFAVVVSAVRSLL